MAGVLTLGQWIGGPDDVKVESTFPSSQRTYSYNFSQNVSSWTFRADYQTVVVNAITYDREGNPNFADSQVIGYFPSGVISTSSYISVPNVQAGTVLVTHPSGLYPETAGILPDSRKNIPLLVISFAWTDNSSPKVTNMHRMAKIMAWEPGVSPQDPTTVIDNGYISLV